MKKYLLTLICICCFFSQVCASMDTLAKVKEILGQFRSLNAYGYGYVVTNTYPGVAPVKAEGIVYIDKSKRSLYEKGDYSTTVLNDSWYYKAEHEAKSVSVVYLPHTRHKQEQNYLNQFFNGSAMYIPDSILERYGHILSYTQTASQVSFRLRLTNSNYQNLFEMVYDKVHKIPVSLSVQTAGIVNGNRIRQDVRCSSFKAIVPPGIFSVSPFFDVRSGKVQLKQYGRYKIHSEL